MAGALIGNGIGGGRRLLWAHVLLVVAIALTYALLNVDPHVDRPLVSAVTVLGSLMSGAWGALLFYVGLVADKDRTIALWKRFARALLRRKAYLWASIAVLAGAELILLRELLWFRAVGLQATEPVEAFLSDVVGRPASLGIVRKGDCSEPTRWVRLSSGEHKLAFARPNGGEALAARVVTVPPLWGGAAPVVGCISGGDYDALG